jgi:hypothetical protein
MKSTRTGTSTEARGQCTHCTAPTDGVDVCAFCATYIPPATAAQRIDVTVNRVDVLLQDLNDELQGLSADAPLFAVTDLVAALGHLRLASRLLEKASTTLETETAAVPQ